MSKNVTHSVEDNKLKIEVDLGVDFGFSKSGKTIVVGTTGGFVQLDGGIMFSLNVNKREQ